MIWYICGGGLEGGGWGRGCLAGERLTFGRLTDTFYVILLVMFMCIYASLFYMDFLPF